MTAHVIPHILFSLHQSSCLFQFCCFSNMLTFDPSQLASPAQPLSFTALIVELCSQISYQSFKQQVPFQREECVITFLKLFFKLHTSQFNWALYQHLLWGLVCLSVPAPSYHFGICSGLEYCLSSTGFSLIFEIMDCSSKQLTGYSYGYNTVGPHWCIIK